MLVFGGWKWLFIIHCESSIEFLRWQIEEQKKLDSFCVCSGRCVFNFMDQKLSFKCGRGRQKNNWKNTNWKHLEDSEKCCVKQTKRLQFSFECRKSFLFDFFSCASAGCQKSSHDIHSSSSSSETMNFPTLSPASHRHRESHPTTIKKQKKVCVLQLLRHTRDKVFLTSFPILQAEEKKYIFYQVNLLLYLIENSWTCAANNTTILI